MGDGTDQIECYSARYGSFLDEIRTDIDELLRRRVLSKALDLSAKTGQHFNHNEFPLYFTGDLDASFVLVHLNPKQANKPEPRLEGSLRFGSFEEYVDWHRHFGARSYGQGTARNHRSPFDRKQIRFLRPFGTIDFVDERTREDRFLNLERVVDDKLQLELIPYGSESFSTRGFTEDVLRPHYERLIRVIATRTRRYVIFCGRVFEALFGEYVVDQHEFQLRKKDGTLERQRSRYANLELPYDGGSIRAGLAYSWAKHGIPMSSYAEEIRERYKGD